MQTILVTEPEFQKAEAVFRAAGDLACAAASPEELGLAEAVGRQRARAVIVGVETYRGPLYEALGKQGGGIIARFGVGHENIDKALARKQCIVITNTPGVLDQSVAEHALWLMGCLARRIAQLDHRLRVGKFFGQSGFELHGRTLGIVGLGHIGRRLAAMAHFGLGMEVIACGQREMTEDLARCGVQLYTACTEEMFRQSDILSVHLPSDATTRHFINADRLTWLRPTAHLINTSRGAVLDEVALFDALNRGQLAGAALDVFEIEPYRPVHPDKDLRTLRNVVLTPHIGSNTQEANARMAEAALSNVRHFLAGESGSLSPVDQP